MGHPDLGGAPGLGGMLLESVRGFVGDVEHLTGMLSYSVAGQGSLTLVFLHYFGGSRREWDGVISRLAGRYRCVAVDAPGFGESSDSDLEGYTVEEMTQQVLELVASIQGEYVLVGHSMMGKVSMVAASRKPERLRGLVLVAPSPLVPEPMTEAARATMVAGNESRETALEFFVKGAKTELDAETQRIGVEDVLRANPVAWRRWPQSGTREDWSGAIPPLQLPSLLVVGEFDEAIPAVFQREHTLPKLEQGRMELVKGVAHLIPYEAPGELAGLIDRFVAGLVG